MSVRMACKTGLIIMLSLLVACNQYGARKKASNLEQSITLYGVALRWAEHQTAYSYHVSPDGMQPPVNLERLQDISVTGIDITDKQMNRDQSEAYVKGIIRYFNKNKGTEKKIKLDQTWWYKEESKRWYIDAEFPAFE